MRGCDEQCRDGHLGVDGAGGRAVCPLLDLPDRLVCFGRRMGVLYLARFHCLADACFGVGTRHRVPVVAGVVRQTLEAVMSDWCD